MIDNNQNDQIDIKVKQPEPSEFLTLQEQHVAINDTLNMLLAQGGVQFVLLSKICEVLKIDLTELMETMKKQAEANKVKK